MNEPAPAFSVVVPAFDEEAALPATLDALRSVLDAQARSYEIVVVDDGSTDATRSILAERADVTVVRHDHNRGYGAALKAGIAAARHNLVVVMDADGSYPVPSIPALVDGCAAADMVVGARIGPRVHATPARSVAKGCFRLFAQWITGTRIPDLNSGLRAFDRSVAERFLRLLPDGFSFTTTITVASLVERLAVRFEPVDYLPRIGRSKVRPVRDTLRIGRQLVWVGFQLAPMRTSAAFAVALLLAAVTSSLRHVALLGGLALEDWGLLAAAVVVMAAGLRAEQRVRRRRCLGANGMLSSRGALAA